jgi:large subunit ribosomal protein L14
MILKQTRLIVADNTGGRVAMCIGMLGKPSHVASIGRIINVAIKEAKPIPANEVGSNSSNVGKVKQGQVHKALVIRTRKEFQRPDGRVIRFDDNACVLLAPDHKPLGTRVLGPVPMELKKGNWLKVLSLSSKII